MNLKNDSISFQTTQAIDLLHISTTVELHIDLFHFSIKVAPHIDPSRHRSLTFLNNGRTTNRSFAHLNGRTSIHAGIDFLHISTMVEPLIDPTMAEPLIDPRRHRSLAHLNDGRTSYDVQQRICFVSICLWFSVPSATNKSSTHRHKNFKHIYAP